MTLKNLSEVVWRFYQNGRASANNQNLRQADIDQMCRMSFGILLRKRYFEGKAENEGTDIQAGSLDLKEFDLSEPNRVGMRSAVMQDELLRMPKNSDITNVYPVTGEDCGESVNGEITQVMPGEENFYLGEEFSDFQFFVQKGKNINTYNLPPCIKKIQVERIYVSDDVDVPLDMAYEISLSILGLTLNIKEFVPINDNSFDANKNQLRYQLEKQEAKV